MYRDSYDVIILAGGNSTRFGVDKCDFEIDGRTMLERVASSFQSPIIVTDKSRQVNGTVIHDNEKMGPLHAIKLAMRAVSSGKVFVTGCDFPYISRNLVSHLCKQPEFVGTTLTDGEFQPLLACYNTSYLMKAVQKSNSLIEVILSSPSVYIAGFREIEMLDPSLLTLVNINRVTDFWNKPKRFWVTRIIGNTERIFVL
ncbi:molybdenum cofactor guanylyltransferase [Metallosphaera hakonensis]|uniref:Molybdopterin-guanine dinucleotide biosynthesis protein MobA n=1 Tax=Metallosphaera hakonensis JCM 8857 = DSM 7519 TaxID=1293036 RepID=A0A2U9IUD9_9CREN|nr:molybdenum cofactor guanylyltransferase [Metallosphaera hakonensis]AWR99701.1 NTP transferase domain-containing protein [Metallosphaera hakonensis JCM 8857 = DSM 7519]